MSTSYTLHIPGLGTSRAHHAGGLRIGGMGLAELVERVTAGSGGGGRAVGQEVLWLDIEAPGVREVEALAHVFGIRRDVAVELVRGIGSHRMPAYACRCYPGQVYVRWAEQDLVSQGTFYESRMATGTAFGTGGGSASWDINEVVDGRGSSRLGKAVRRLVHSMWAPSTRQNSSTSEYDEHQEKENSKSLLAGARTQPSAGSRATRPGFRPSVPRAWIQSWVGGQVLLTFHQNASHAVTEVMKELETKEPRADREAEPALDSESILQALICRWVRDSGGQYADWLDRVVQKTMGATTAQAKPVSVEWVQTAASCRRLNLTVLRNCHEGQRVLRTLRLLRSSRPATAKDEHHNKHWHGVSFAHIPSIAQILRYIQETNSTSAVYDMLYSQQKAVFRRHKEIERRLAISDSLALARQRGWLLVSEKKILHSANIWLLAHFVYAPIELWRNLNNINENETPGELMQNSALLFYWQLPAFAVWAVVAYFLYTAHVRRLYAREWKKLQPTTPTYAS